MSSNLNLYGDRAAFLSGGHGADIASQRADDLDRKCLNHLSSLEAPLAIDLACGVGGQTLRMAQAGARVVAVDQVNFAPAILAQADNPALRSLLSFVQCDMRALSPSLFPGLADAIICQRAIHYLPYDDATVVLKRVHQLLAPSGQLFISASGIHSELGTDYQGTEVSVFDRYYPLSDSVASKHDIRGPVCLYSETDMIMLLREARFLPIQVYSSPFGNIKAVARHV